MDTAIIVIIVIGAIIVAAVKIAQQVSESKDAQLAGFGFSVRGAGVFWHNQRIGDLAGSEAPVSDGTSRHTLTRVVTIAGRSPSGHGRACWLRSRPAPCKRSRSRAPPCCARLSRSPSATTRW